MTAPAVGLVTDDAALAELEGEWAALWRRVPDATPFASPAWLLAWWRQFGTGQPRAAVLRDGDGRLAGVLPLYVLREPGGAKLLPIGVGPTDGNDVLLAPGAPAGAAAMLLAAALAGSPDAAACDLPDLPPGSPLRRVSAPAGWEAGLFDTDPCPVLTLPGSVERMRDAVPALKLRDLRMARHRAARIGGWTTEVATAATVQPFLRALIDLHQARWTARGEPGSMADPRVPAFHREAAPALLRQGSLRLQVLRFGSAIAAACLVLLAGRDRILFYLSGFDAAYRRESPGTILLGEMLEAAIAEGRREADFLRGAEAYKYQWGARDRRNAMLRLRRA